MPQAKSDLPEIKVNVFPGGFNWGLYIGIDKRIFAEQGITIAVLPTPNSVTQMSELSQGKFDIAMTAVDNVVAYREGQGEAPIGAQPEFFAFMGSDTGFLRLVTAADITAIDQLRGKILSVDAATTGYAFVLYEILRRKGLGPDDYHLRKVGGMVQRLNSLFDNNEAGTLLSAPYNLLAKARGLKQLVTAVSVLGPYQGNVAAARRSWAERNRDKVIAFIRGYRRAISWLYEPANRDEAIDILASNVPNMSKEIAEASYQELVSPQEGFFPDCKINIAGLRCVLELRNRYAVPKRQLADAMAYCDLSYFDEATTGD